MRLGKMTVGISTMSIKFNSYPQNQILPYTLTGQIRFVTSCRRILISAILIVTLMYHPAQAQSNIQNVLVQVILQLQTGTPNPQWYGSQLWQTIAAQTGNTGIYPALQQLGPVKGTTLVQQTALPTGVLYLLIAQHQNGASTWILGISSLTNRIEYGNFVYGSNSQALPYEFPGGSPTSPTSPSLSPRSSQPNPPPNSPPPQTSTSEACKKFPNLC